MRRLRGFGMALSLIALTLAVPSSVALVDAGLVAVEVDVDSTEHCIADLGPLHDLCPVSWDHGDSPLPGDDYIALAKRIDEARVTGRVPGASPHQAAVNLSELRVQHPAYRTLNQTWIQLNDTLPREVRQYVAFESRPAREFVNGTWQDTGEWGVFLVVYFPEPVNVTGQPIYWLSPVAICWNNCMFDDQEYLQGDEDSLHPFPNNVLLDGRNTDYYVRGWADVVGSCWATQEILPAEQCGTFADLRAMMEPAVGLYESLTPTVGVGFQFNRTVMQVEPSAEHEGGAGQASPPVQDALRGAAGMQFPPPGSPVLWRVGHPAAPWSVPSWALPSGGDASESPAAPSAALLEPVGLPVELAVAAAALFAAAWVLYHRITRAQVLAQATRQRVFQLIREDPGIRVGTLATRLGLAYPTVEAHVRVLERFGLVRKAGEAQKRYFAADAGTSGEVQLYAEVLTSPSTRAVYEFLASQREGADLQRVGEVLGLSPSTVSEAATKLSRAGVVERARVRRRVVLRLSRNGGGAGAERPPPAVR